MNVVSHFKYQSFLFCILSSCSCYIQVAISALEATHSLNEIQMQFSMGEFDSRLQVCDFM